MEPHLTFFVDPAWRRVGQHIPLLYPFWGNAQSSNTPFYKTLFDQYSFDTRYYRITDNPEHADMVLLPYGHRLTLLQFPDLLTTCAVVAEQLHLPLLIDGTGDIECSVDLPNTLVLRYGGYRFEKKDNEIHIPLYADDLLERYAGGVWSPRHKSAGDIPTVGFAGWGALSMMQTVRAFVKEIPDRLRSVFDYRYHAKKKGVFFRAAAIAALEHSPIVKANIVRRRGYSGHTGTADASPEQLRREFVDNLLGSDYCLDVRGDANASIRLFEITSLGRIPVIVDTERNFPFSDALDYATFSLRVDMRDVNQLPERIAAFHASLTDEQFVEMQRAARAAFEQYFCVEAITRHLMRAIAERLPATAPSDTPQR